eukprot:4081828-Alexandrium_andersonii.AAC.1
MLSLWGGPASPHFCWGGGGPPEKCAAPLLPALPFLRVSHGHGTSPMRGMSFHRGCFVGRLVERPPHLLP